MRAAVAMRSTNLCDRGGPRSRAAHGKWCEDGNCICTGHPTARDWPVKPPARSSRATKGRGSSSTGSVRGSTTYARRRPGVAIPGWATPARLRVLRLGTILRFCAKQETRATRQRCVRRVRVGRTFLGGGAEAWTRSTPPAHRAGVTTYKAVKCRVRAFDGLRRPSTASRPRASGRAVREDRRCLGRRRRPHRFEAGARHRPRRRIRLQRATEDPVEGIVELGGADQAIVLAVSPTACEQAYRSLKRGGRSSWSGCRRTTSWPADLRDRPRRITVTGSIVGTRVDLAETFQLHMEAARRSCASPGAWNVNESFEQIEKGDGMPAW